MDKIAAFFETALESYDIKFCDVDEIDDVIKFIDMYWKNGHILVKSRELMDWQHFDKRNNRYNFVLARYKETGEIHACLGFITPQFFDPEIANLLFWGSIWKTRDDVKGRGLGILLYYYVEMKLNIETICLLGISEEGKNNYKSLGFLIGRAEQYVFPNSTAKEFRIAKGIEKYRNRNYYNSKDWNLHKLSLQEYDRLDKNAEFFSFVSRYKSKEYYKKRYFFHPVYSYCFYALTQDIAVKAIMVLRECSVNDSYCLRLVEYIGDYSHLVHIQKSINDLLHSHNYEYLDLVIAGVDEDLLKAGGFINIRSDTDIVIPNYFEPYLQKNIDIDYAYISTDPNLNLIIAKGDADQDRPSII
ncbi:MAG: hypothetical protein ACTTKL_01940 [Treponema sp.]